MKSTLVSSSMRIRPFEDRLHKQHFLDNNVIIIIIATVKKLVTSSDVYFYMYTMQTLVHHFFKNLERLRIKQLGNNINLVLYKMYLHFLFLKNALNDSIIIKRREKKRKVKKNSSSFFYQFNWLAPEFYSFYNVYAYRITIWLFIVLSGFWLHQYSAAWHVCCYVYAICCIFLISGKIYVTCTVI